jgi:tryptophan synthase alpha chain
VADSLALEPYIREQRRKNDILLMTHIVVGYPNFDVSLQLVETMVKAGVELMELQIPFSEPMADGPVIVKANQDALTSGANVEKCLEFCAMVSRRFPIPFLVMTYTNLVYRRGIPSFVGRAQAAGVRGLIVPDLPPEEGSEYIQTCRERSIDPIFIFAPTSTDARLAQVAKVSSGFVYCVARKGVTGAHTNFSSELVTYLARARAATSLPLAVGFGVTSKQDIEVLKGSADIAVVGSQSIRVLDQHGTAAVGDFLRGLRH